MVSASAGKRVAVRTRAPWAVRLADYHSLRRRSIPASVWFFARPEGQPQLLGSWLVVWDDLLPEYPAEVAEADAAIVADSLAASCGGHRPPASGSPPA
jgi:hypothetical protein